MSNRLRFQNQHSNHTTPQSNQSSSTPNRNGSKPPTTTEKTIQTNITVQPRREDVSAVAYRIYLEEGRPQGRDLQHWLEAEAQLAAGSPLTIKTELTVKTETTVKNEVGLTPAHAGKE